MIIVGVVVSVVRVSVSYCRSSGFMSMVIISGE